MLASYNLKKNSDHQAGGEFIAFLATGHIEKYKSSLHALQRVIPQKYTTDYALVLVPLEPVRGFDDAIRATPAPRRPCRPRSSRLTPDSSLHLSASSSRSSRFVPRIISNAFNTRRGGTIGRRLPALQTKDHELESSLETAKKSFLVILCGENGEKVELFAGTYGTARWACRGRSSWRIRRGFSSCSCRATALLRYFSFGQNVFELERAESRQETGARVAIQIIRNPPQLQALPWNTHFIQAGLAERAASSLRQSETPQSHRRHSHQSNALWAFCRKVFVLENDTQRDSALPGRSHRIAEGSHTSHSI
ncbi:hypothetical protein B0H14DRAFT_3787230 [Mycena olivaceomarginata]|nr:hypothetical protein B0H14DRAFT_3787230 [Mycena olivaceomarginata]